MRQSYKLDEKDHRILGFLREHSRASIREISAATKIRPSTVHQRLNKLIKNNIIEKFTLKLNNRAMGENFIVFVWLKTTTLLPDSLFKEKYVKEAFGITGEYDLLIKLKFPDVEAFNDFIITFRKKYELGQTMTMVVTDTIKEEL